MAELELIVADYNISSWSLRPFLALRQAQATFTMRQILLDRPTTKAEIHKVSPSGQIPCLLVDGQPIWDSLAICEFAAEIAPNAALWPAERMARAHCRSVSAEMHSAFRALPFELRMNIVGRKPAPVLTEKCAADVERIFAVWRDCRGRFESAGPFLFGRFSIADAMFAPVVTRFTTYSWPADGPILAYMDTIRSLPAMQEWRMLALQEVTAAQVAAN